MSSEGDNAKNVSSEANDKSTTDTEESSQDSQDVKDAKIEKGAEVVKKNDEAGGGGESDAKRKEGATSKEESSAKQKNDDAKADKEEKVNDVDEKEAKDKKKKKKESNDTEEGEEGSEKEEEEEGSDDKGVPLLDQPLEQSGPRERKKVQRFNEEFKDNKEPTKVDIPTGTGTPLGEIPRVDASISRFRNEDLRLLHRLLFKTPGKTTVIKRNVKKFNGFDFAKDSEEYSKKIAAAHKFEVKQLKSICEMLDVEKKGTKDEIIERIVEFLMEPKDSGKPVGGGRPKRTAAVRANNRGYSSHDDYSSDERQATRARRDKGKRSNLKEESSSESDEDFNPSDASEERAPRVKSQRGKRKKVQSEEEEEEASELEESLSSEESDDEPRNKRKRGSNKVTNSKAKGKATGKTRGRKPAASKTEKTPAKRGRKKAETSEEESEQQDDGSSSEDEPLAKKAKSPQPPTDEEIKAYVKEILEGANLEEITMKTVCKQVYAHYPDFDLAHKKDFIKSTVKSLIST